MLALEGIQLRVGMAGDCSVTGAQVPSVCGRRDVDHWRSGMVRCDNVDVRRRTDVSPHSHNRSQDVCRTSLSLVASIAHGLHFY